MQCGMLLQVFDGRMTTAHPFLWPPANTENARETWRGLLGFGKRHYQAMMMGEDGFHAVRHDQPSLVNHDNGVGDTFHLV